MFEVHFIYNGKDTLIQCTENEKFNNICQSYSTKIERNINKLIFIYGGATLNKDLLLKEAINKTDKEKLKMNVLVSDVDSTTQNERLIKSKDIICPNCGELCQLNFNNFKIVLNNCKNKHENILSLYEFENTQNINENKIKCDKCNNIKAETYKNKLYICGTCNIKICPLCNESHNKKHK